MSMADKRHQTATWNREDRDLLVELRTEQANTRNDLATIRSELRDINTGISNRVLNLESNAVSRIELKELNDRTDNLELWRSMLIGAWGVCTLILIPLAFAYFTHGA
jgi:hypothetical protein